MGFNKSYLVQVINAFTTIKRTPPRIRFWKMQWVKRWKIRTSCQRFHSSKAFGSRADTKIDKVYVSKLPWTGPVAMRDRFEKSTGDFGTGAKAVGDILIKGKKIDLSVSFVRSSWIIFFRFIKSRDNKKKRVSLSRY